MDTSKIEKISHHSESASVRAGDIIGAVQHLEAIFLRAECDLSYVSRKLDTEFETTFAERGQENVRRHHIKIDK